MGNISRSLYHYDWFALPVCRLTKNKIVLCQAIKRLPPRWHYHVKIYMKFRFFGLIGSSIEEKKNFQVI